MSKNDLALCFTRPSILDPRVHKDHILREIVTHVNFDYIYKEIEDNYGNKGNVLVPPPVTLKMRLLLILYRIENVDITGFNGL
jgi:hypothetical protein